MNKARACANFNGASPLDVIVTSHVQVTWGTNLGNAAPSEVTYVGPYSAVGSAITMDLNFASTIASVTGSFAGTTANLDLILPIVTPQCPVAAGNQVSSSGTLGI